MQHQPIPQAVGIGPCMLYTKGILPYIKLSPKISMNLPNYKPLRTSSSLHYAPANHSCCCYWTACANRAAAAAVEKFVGENSIAK
jgi:hypothetical protein